MTGLGLTIALLTSPPPTGGVVLVYTPSIETHRRLVQRLERLDPSIVALAIDDPWPKTNQPRVALALGAAGLQRVRADWPTLPRAALLQWSIPPADASVELWSRLRPEPQCTATLLRERFGDSGWVVLADPYDDEAHELAAALGAVLVAGSPAQKHRGLSQHRRSNIWLRPHPTDMSAPEWIAWLGRWGAADGVFVGSDLPALARLGYAHPIEIDLDAMARDTTAWLHRVRRRAVEPRVELEVQCQRT